MKVLLLSRYGSLGASSRVRHLQYLDDFKANGWTVEVSPLFSNAYLEALYAGRGRVRQTLRGYAERILALGRVRQFDVLVIEKELFPFLPALLERLLARLGVPYVVDYDDALFHRYDRHPSLLVRRLLGRKIDVVMRQASVVVAGNEYLAERAQRAGAARVEVIPTVVDKVRYRPRQGTNEIPVIGWIGTPKTCRYLQPLLPVFEVLQKERPVRFVAVGARPEDFVGTPVETRPWSEETEVDSIQQFDVGIMPLEDSPWERGKCGYKLIQYMACGIPVIASPVGVNVDIVTNSQSGFLADTPAEWSASLCQLLDSPQQRRTMGNAGRQAVERTYSLQVQAPILSKSLQKAVNSEIR